MQRVLIRRIGVLARVSAGRPVLKELSLQPQTLFPTVKKFSESRLNMSYSSVERGCQYTMDYRIYFKAENGNFISPFHDIPLYPDKDKDKSIVNMVVEIPRWSNAKMEIKTNEKLNPIAQDVKKGKIRFVKNVFPHHGYIWNYGAIPQTWEDPNHKTEATGTLGDKDPLDICEIGYKVQKRGSVIQVKVLGIMCLVDEGETDWKVIAIDVTDPLAEKLNDIEDVEKEMPGFLKATDEWFRIYKIPDGKPQNTMAFEGAAKNKEYAMKVISECNQQWTNLLANGGVDSGICCENTSVAGSSMISGEDASKIVEESTRILHDKPECGESSGLEDDVDKWYYTQKS